MNSSLDTVRIDQVGSLAGPEALRAALTEFDNRRLDAASLEQLIDDAVRAVLARQEAIGLPVLSDGEFRRRNFQESFAAAVRGFDGAPQVTTHDDLSISRTPLSRAEQNFEASGPAILTRRPVIERLHLVRNVPLDEFKAAQRYATHPVKATLLSPDRISQRFAWEASRAVYPDMDAFMADVVAIERQMISELVAAGCRYIQIDAPGYTAYADQVSIERMKSRGEDPKANLARSIAADNALIAGFDGGFVERMSSIGSTSPRDRSCRMASPNAPTPGRTSRSASATRCGSSVTRAAAPSRSKAFWTLRRFPLP
jgi:5-methyltetrahydropteroyltriglutamate--homocysteine methyltransferase